MKNFKYSLIGAFILILLLPNVVMIVDLAYDSDGHTKVPAFNLRSPIRSLALLRDYYNENLGLKKNCIDIYVNAKINGFGDDPFPNKVITGKNGWYFLGDSYNDLFKDAFGNLNISNAKLESVSNELMGIKKYLKQQDIDFYIVFPPNKHNIYKEYLPFSLRQKDTRLDRLNSYLTTNAGISIIDLRDVLRKNKKTDLYLKTDTHWNQYGAFLGYDKVMEEINTSKIVAKRNIKEYIVNKSIKANGDITKMLNLDIATQDLQLSPKFTPTKVVMESTNDKVHIINKAKPFKLLMYRDSFADAWMDFFDETFGEVVYLKGATVNEQDIEKEKPDIVIIELIERNLEYLVN